MPGAPHSSTPAGVLAPIRRKRSGFLRNVTSSMISDLTCIVAVRLFAAQTPVFKQMRKALDCCLPGQEAAE